MDFSRAVQVMRTVRAMTQNDLAAAAGINRSIIWQIESGLVIPGPELEQTIKAALRWPARADEAFAILEGDDAN